MIDLLTRYGDIIIAGLGATVWIVLAGFFAGAVAGTLLATGLISSRRWLRTPIRAYVELVRNTPFLIQAMLLFATFGVLRIRIDPTVAGTLAVAIYTSAYMAEIVRGGFKSVATGQWEAATALGLRSLPRFRLVIFPQLLPFVLPAGVNLIATVAKESAFLSAVSVAELTYSGQVVIAQTFRVFEVWAIVGMLYLLLVLSILAAARRLSRRLEWSLPKAS